MVAFIYTEFRKSRRVVRRGRFLAPHALPIAFPSRLRSPVYFQGCPGRNSSNFGLIHIAYPNGRYWDRTSGLFDRIEYQRGIISDPFPIPLLQTGRATFAASGFPKVPTRKPQKLQVPVNRKSEQPHTLTFRRCMESQCPSTHIVGSSSDCLDHAFTALCNLMRCHCWCRELAA